MTKPQPTYWADEKRALIEKVRRQRNLIEGLFVLSGALFLLNVFILVEV